MLPGRAGYDANGHGSRIQGGHVQGNALRVLAIDGGGIRGLIPAYVLAYLEDRTGRPVAELFDVVAGTSTGAILTLGLAMPSLPGGTAPRFGAADLVALYRDEGPEVFRRSWWRRVPGIGFVTDLAAPRYGPKGIEAVLQRRFTHADGSHARLSEALVEVLVPSYDLAARSSYFFKSHLAKISQDDDAPMWQVCRAASAAPSYFPPALVEMGSHRRVLTDGGVVANNPAVCAYVEALKERFDARPAVVVSLGTGENTRPIGYREASGWGIKGWAVQVMGVLLDGTSDAVDHQLSHLLDHGRYFRFQTRLFDGVRDDMDDASVRNTAALERAAQRLLMEHTVALDYVAKLLTT